MNKYNKENISICSPLTNKKGSGQVRRQFLLPIYSSCWQKISNKLSFSHDTEDTAYE